MSHYSLYIPGQRFGRTSFLQPLGLAELEENCGWDWCEVTEGPDGASGVIGTVLCADPVRRPAHGYRPDIQRWSPCPPDEVKGICKGDLWFGIEPERPPSPIDLQHSRTYEGQFVKLKDGNEWKIPESLSLPMQVGRDPETGELQKYYPDKFSEFCRMTERFVYTFFENIALLNVMKQRFPEMDEKELTVTFELEESWEYASRALSINYRVCDPLVGYGYLDLMNEMHMVMIIRATIALPDIIDVIKKNKIDSPVLIPVGLNTDDG